MSQQTPFPRQAFSGYPFSAICGQGPLKQALILGAIDLSLGGVLLRGEKGTAKSTASRALASVLPPLEIVKGCPVGCDPNGPLCPYCQKLAPPLPVETALTPFVDLPLGATSDRVLGSMDIEEAVQRGRQKLKPGLLAKAHRGVLYIDEINLLPAHVMHTILDACASGRVVVEREGISFTHPAQFALVASCNPEEGPLGPQILDRFGLSVDVIGEREPSLRKEVLIRRMAFEKDASAFRNKWAPTEIKLRQRLILARKHLPLIQVPARARALASELAGSMMTMGQRGELSCIKAARALAAWQGAKEVSLEMVNQTAPLALAHRTPVRDLNQAAQPSLRLSHSLPKEEDQEPVRVVKVDRELENSDQAVRQGDERTLFLLEPGPVTPVGTRLPAREGTSRVQTGRRHARESVGDRGRYLRASPKILGRPLALDATVRAAAPHQKNRRVKGGPALVVRKPDIREKVRSAKKGRLVLFCVDASGSMNAATRMSTTKAAILGLLTEAYQKRDRVGLVAFGGVSAKVLLPPTSSVEVARRMLAELPTGGKTPLAAGLVAVSEVLAREMTRDPGLTPLVVILTDGRPNVPLNASELGKSAGQKGGGWGDGWGDGGYADREVLNLAKAMANDPRPNYVIVDTDTGNVQEINLCQPMAQYMGAKCVSLGKLTAEGVLDLVRAQF